jgi:probable rRNA maturation factor
LVKIPSGLNAKLVIKIVNATRAELKIKKEWEVTVMAVSPGYIKKLNKQYRHKNKVTDVLSFSQQEGPAMILAGQKQIYLGDIILCLDQIKKQAKLFGHSFKREFSLLTIHGLLHLLGYDDKTQKQYEIMAKIQDEVLAKIYGKSIKTNKKL